MTAPSITEKEFRQLSAYIKHMYGINLKEDRMSLVNGRLANMLMQRGIPSFEAYYQYVINDRTGRAAIELVDKISTNHTFFMREAEHFTFFRDKVLPWLEQTVRSRDLRVWCAGCSTGQESYTLAMLMEDYFRNRPPEWDKKLLATDISTKVLEEAVRGEYAVEQTADLPKLWRTQYFKRAMSGTGSTLTVSDAIKSQVIYRKFNLMDPRFPFKRRFHVIFCRNVMIYFDNPTKEQLVDKFWEMTEPGGYLFISQSESLIREKTRYKYIMPGVYRKEG